MLPDPSLYKGYLFSVLFMNRFKRKALNAKKLARSHVDGLFRQVQEDSSRGDRYIALARKVAMKFKLKLGSDQKRMFCKHCYKALYPGKNLRIRVHEHRIIYYCLECKKFWRKPL